jgi:hypothetical protein
VHPEVDFDAGAFESAEACAAYALVRICHRHDDAPDAGVDRKLGARWASVLVRTGFEVDVQRAVSRPVTRCGESQLLRVRLSSLLVISLAGNVALSVQDNCTHHRVGAGSVVSLACEFDGARRPMKVYVSVAFRRMQSSKYIRDANQTA